VHLPQPCLLFLRDHRQESRRTLSITVSARHLAATKKPQIQFDLGSILRERRRGYGSEKWVGGRAAARAAPLPSPPAALPTSEMAGPFHRPHARLPAGERAAAPWRPLSCPLALLHLILDTHIITTTPAATAAKSRFLSCSVPLAGKVPFDLDIVVVNVVVRRCLRS
jgi:hypothetical protein